MHLLRSLCSAALLLHLALPAAPGAEAQPLADTLFAWRGYAQRAHCRVRVYATPPGEDRSHVVVLQELADNPGPTTISDARHLAELVGRDLGIDPAEAWWLFHWGSFSYEGAAPDRRKELFLRATFKRSKSGGLMSPLWKVVTREEVEAYTDRQFQ